MGHVGVLLSLRLKEYFGSLRVSRTSLMVMLGIVFSMFVIGGGLGYVVARGGFVYWGLSISREVLLSSLLSFITIFLSFYSVLNGVGGSLTDINYVASSPVSPRDYLVSDMLFQWAMLNVFIGPALASATIYTYLVGAGDPFLLLMEAYMFVAIGISQVFGVLKQVDRREVLAPLFLAFLAAYLTPALEIVGIELGYLRVLALPNVFAELMVGRVQPISIASLTLQLAVLTACYLRLSNLNIYYNLKPTLVGFAPISYMPQLERYRRLTRLLPLLRFVELDTERFGSFTLSLLKELLRNLRSGVLLASVPFMLYVVFLVPVRGRAFPVFISLSIAIASVELWRFAEKPALWSFLQSPDARSYFAGLIAGSALFIFALSLLIDLLMVGVEGLRLIPYIAASSIASSGGGIYYQLRFAKGRNQLADAFISMTLMGLSSLAAIIPLRLIEVYMPVLLFPVSPPYLLLVFLAFYSKCSRGVVRDIGL